MKKLDKDEAMPQHEAIFALKQIALDRNDPYLASQIQSWLNDYILHLSHENKVDLETINSVKNPSYYLNNLTKKSLIELGAGAASMAAETFHIESEEVIKFRMLALRSKKEEK